MSFTIFTDTSGNIDSALAKKYDIKIPISKNIGVAQELIIETINELSEGHYPKKKNSVMMLCDGTVLDKDSIVKDCGLKNGDTIIIV